MEFKESLGIDVSKKTIDVMLHCKKLHRQFKNTTKGFNNLIRWAEKQTGIKMPQIIICFEHTGIYSLPLATYLYERQLIFSMVPAIEIKRSMGLVRGKNDAVDAERIAEYAYLRRGQIKPYNLPSKNILQLQKILTLRDKMVKQRAGYKSDLKETKTMLKSSDYELFFSTQKKMIHYFDKQITRLDEQIIQIIKDDEAMNKIHTLITSVRGIGVIISANFIVLTNCFTDFNDSRKFACYSGIAPFEKQSGTSLNSKSRVSHFANKKMKSLLNMAAFSAIQSDPELRMYYLKRVEEGKSKMSTINIVRNKIVHRVFAVVKRGTPYVVLQNHAA
ncbi:MAG: IS110 family transposase [Flavobacteriales bacterium]|nr:IS110 family transposase [Flavobacteriales bacterium]